MTTETFFEDRLITVCDRCFKASCWQGVFFCDEYFEAGTIEKPVSDLRKLALESPGWWQEQGTK